MERQWNGKNVLVSGAENEIGRAVARMFASHGARIAVAAPVREEAEKVVAEISESGGEAIAFSADPADVDQVRRMVRCVTETLGSIDILVNNAGGDNLHAVGIVKAFSESEPAQWAPFLESVLRGTIATIRYVLPQMIVRRTGRIVNLVSVAGVSGLQGAPIRSAVEGGIIALTRSLAMDCGACNICVNSIASGAIQMKPGPESTIGGSVFGRSGTPEEVAKLVCFLCSEDAGYITGQNYIIDGGCILGPKEE